MTQRWAMDHSSIRGVGLDQSDDRTATALNRDRKVQCRRSIGPSSASSLRLISRAASIGVSVNETSSETAIANEDVKPNDDMKRPDDAAHESDRQEDGQAATGSWP